MSAAICTAAVVTLLAPGLAAGPPLSPDVLSSPFGVVNPWPGVGHRGMGAVWCRCGAGSTQLGSWPGAEALPGVFDWTRSEREWDAYYVKEDLVPVPILGYTPTWASSQPQADQAGRFPPSDLDFYQRFCRAISARFRGRVWFWEVWNEPNIGFFHGTIAQYADMVKTAALAVRSGNPGAYVVFGGMAGVDQPFLDRCYQYGVREYFDVLAAHPYQWGKVFDDGWFNDKLTRLRATASAHGDAAKPAWLNEVGWSTGDKKITQEDQARLLVQVFVTALARRDAGVERLFWFCVKDWGGPGYGLYAADGSKKTAWYAYREMVHRLGGLECRGKLDVGPRARAYLFADEGSDRGVFVFWSTDLEEGQIAFPSPDSLGEMYDLTGKSLPAGRRQGNRLFCTATPAPRYLQVTDVQALASHLQSPPERPVRLPSPDRRPTAWLSLYPQPGCSLPWLRRGARTLLQARFFNGTDRAVSGQTLAEVLEPREGQVLTRTMVPVSAGPHSATRFTVPLAVPATAPEVVHIRLHGQGLGLLPDPAVFVEALVVNRACINFLANSYLERSWYLQPGAKSGTAESVRFGSDWVYRLPRPEGTAARVRMKVGADRAQQWQVDWSSDGKSWHKLYAGASNRAWHEGSTAAAPGDVLYLHCHGKGMQVGEVVVSY